MARPRNEQTARQKFTISIFKLKMVVGKLRKSLLLQLSPKRSSYKVARDVKKGHFAVIMVVDDEEKRAIVPLNCLTNPTFLRLLEKSEEEYGFKHEGVLTIPCRPEELERIFDARGGM